MWEVKGRLNLEEDALDREIITRNINDGDE